MLSLAKITHEYSSIKVHQEVTFLDPCEATIEKQGAEQGFHFNQMAPIHSKHKINQSTISSKTFLQSRCCLVLQKNICNHPLPYGQVSLYYTADLCKTMCSLCLNASQGHENCDPRIIYSQPLSNSYMQIPSLKPINYKTYFEWGLQMLPPYWDLKYPGWQGLTVPAIEGKYQYFIRLLKIMLSHYFLSPIMSLHSWTNKSTLLSAYSQ